MTPAFVPQNELQRKSATPRERRARWEQEVADFHTRQRARAAAIKARRAAATW